MTGACTSCSGPRLVDHPAGLVFQHDLSCPLLAAEDATRAADHTRAAGSWRFTRPVTAAERTLLAGLGHDLDEDAVTLVSGLTSSVLSRSWHGVDLDPIETVDD